ncbi:MAG: acetyl-CoA carboxylase, biotin carboxyl carrier protein [Planctomycetes bacterium RBG_16_43_13]|nr:MAG: acetyl-CoA carboxylase, biotin carboxyl carrier protein [Planctomycetes bacterium RBG_16_43_13]
MDLEEVKKLLAFMEENDLVEMEYEANGKRFKLRKQEKVVERAPVMIPMPTAVSPTPAEGEVKKKDENIVEFKAPLVGTFYRSPKPDADPFVNVGDEVKPEKVLCIVEAMKVMNEIKAEMKGIVKEILVKNGQAVEFGETLFLIEKK